MRLELVIVNNSAAKSLIKEIEEHRRAIVDASWKLSRLLDLELREQEEPPESTKSDGSSKLLKL